MANDSEKDRKDARCPRRFELDAALSGEVDSDRRLEILGHAEGCPACRESLVRIEREREEFLRQHPYSMLKAGMERLTRKGERRRAIFMRLVPASAAAIAIMIGTWLAWPTAPGVRTKGTVALSLYLMRDGDIRPARPDEVFAHRDRIQFLVSAGPHRYLLLVSVDDAGRVFNYTPGAALESISITPGERRPLPESVELDESRENERVFALFSDEPLSFTEIRSRVEGALSEVKRRGGTVKELGHLSGPWPQASVLLRKH